MTIARLLPLLIVLVPTAALSRDSTCLDSMGSSASSAMCAASIVQAMERQVDQEFKRLAEHLPQRNGTREALQTTKSRWEDYRYSLCLLEAVSAAGGKTEMPLPDASEVALAKCMLRTAEEMYAALKRL